MLRGRPAPASAYLGLVCLLVQAARPTAGLCTRDLLRRVQSLILKAHEQKDLGSRLYTPSRHDYESSLGFTLKCFSEEVKVLLDEWATAGFKLFNGSRFKSKIEDLAVKLNLTEAEGLKCEHLNEENAETFLSELKQTFEKINYDYNSICQ